MYLSHFNLTEKPFQITPDPRFLWLGEKHQEALAALKYGVLDQKGFLLLTGDVGTGKTTLIKALLNSLDHNTVVATVVDPHLEKLEFFNFLADIFGIKETFTKKVDFLARFTQFLNGAQEAGKTVLLIVDESQRLSKELLEEIRLLSNIEKQNTKLLNIFFVGQNEFNALLMESQSRALRQRITITYQIKPLNEAETSEYVKFRLKVAGTEEQIFDRKAIREVFEFSNGYPRLINIICDQALLTAYVRDMRKVSPSVVKECAKELTLPNENRSDLFHMQARIADAQKSRFLPKAVFCVSLLLLLATGGYLVDPGTFRHVFEEVEDFYGNFFGSHNGFDSNMEATDMKTSPTQLPPTTHDNDSQILTFRALPVPSGQSGENGMVEETLPFEATLKDETLQAPINTDFEEEKDEQPWATENHDDHTDGRPFELGTDKAAPPPIFLAEESSFVVPFDYDTNELSSQARVEIDRLAVAMHRNQDIGIIITGYTDSLGSHHYNVKLSQFRAQVVKSYLVAKGISPSRIRTAGMAEENPRETNDTSAGRSANRRVEVRLETNNDS